MGIIAWIVLGLGAGLLANMLIPGRRSQGLILTCLIGVAGALGGGWLATKLFHIHTLHGFFNLSTWLTAIAGAAILLLIFHLVTSRGNAGSGRRSQPAEELRAPVTADIGPTGKKQSGRLRGLPQREVSRPTWLGHRPCRPGPWGSPDGIGAN